MIQNDIVFKVLKVYLCVCPYIFISPYPGI